MENLFFSAGISEKEISHKIIPVVDRKYFPIAKELIQTAKESIYVSMYVVKGGKKVHDLIKQLRKAANKGIKIRILLGKEEDCQLAISPLRDLKNIEIKSGSAIKTIHNKIIIADKKIILIGSTNWTEKSLGYANEANVIINNKEIAEYFQKYLNYLWKDPSKDISPFKNFEGEIIPLIDRQYFHTVKEMMEKSTERIYVMVYGFGLSKAGNILADEIVKARKRGVETRVLLDNEPRINSNTIQYFKKNYVEARFNKKGVTTHSKVVIIDDAVILGATNWSCEILQKWHNTDILIKEKGIVEFFMNYFEEKFSSGR
ncbi:MAG TPA: hypothetical protein ENG63_07720 [Candidatus Desulfofervidus auxilii]|uniref:phospholipase D n=1 Tax=Desulfofervidus auxilii TaxID=1621989 RepID=A0A7C0Y691_DESA2|nr:hypothetical protein [Candidatus Desulfofervidus auxilii]